MRPMGIPDEHMVSVYELSRWRWAEMRQHLRELNGRGYTAMCQESGGLFRKVFVVVAPLASIMLLNKRLGVNVSVTQTAIPR